jgi:endoglucanase
MKYLKELSEIYGASGNESEVKKFIKGKVLESKKIDYIKEDHLGNLMCFKKGKNQKKTLLLMAHMDEVGLMVSDIEEDGRLCVQPVGGVDKRVLLGKRVVVGKKNIEGVIPFKAIHLQDDDYSAMPKWDSIRVDIGSADKKETELKVQLGDYCHFKTSFEEYQNRVVGKAFDDRAGCSMMLEIIEELKELPSYNIVFAFVVQEENGLRGSGAVLKHFHADAALVIEGTTAGDNPELKTERWSTHLDKGPAISYLQSMYVIDRRLFNVILDSAEKLSIPYQLKGRTVGGTDTTRTARSFYGIPGAVVNVPSRYIHSPTCVMSKEDYKNTALLVRDIVMNENFLNSLEV